MKEIQRFSVQGFRDAVRSERGDFVKYDDHAVIVAELQDQVKELASENCALKDVSSDVIRHVYRSKTYLDGSRVIDAIQGLECAIGVRLKPVPATEAAIREINAQGVDDHANDLRLRSIAARENGHVITAECLSSEAERAERFAAQLRAKPEGEQP